MRFQRRLAEGVEAERLGALRQFVQMVVQRVDKGAEFALDARIAPAHVLVDAFLFDPFFQVDRKLLLDRAVVLRQPLVQQVVDGGQRFVQAGGNEGRRLVADDHGAAAPLGLQRLADVVDDVGVDDRHVADGEHRVVADREAALLAGQPFLRAVRAVMDDGVGFESLAQPQVVGQVEMRGRRAGRMVERLLGFFPAFAARRLRGEDDLADGEARNDEEGFATVDDDHGRFFRVAPALLQGFPLRRRQLLQPGAVGGDRQTLGQAVVEQALQFAVAIEGREQALQVVDQEGFRFAVRVVAGGLEGLERDLEAARQVHERGREILFTRGVVPEQHRHLLVGVGFALEAREVQRLVDNGGGLFGDGDDLAGLPVGDVGDDRVDDAGVLALGEVERHVEQRDALRVGAPGGLVALAVGQRLGDGNAEFGQFAAPALGVEDDLGVDDDVGDDASVQRQHGLVRAHHAGEIGKGDGAAGFDAGDEIVDEASLLGADVDLVHGDGDGGRALGRVDVAPAEIVARRRQDALRRLRVIDGRIGKDERRRHLGRRFMTQVGGERREEAIEVGASAVGVVSVQGGGGRLGKAVALRAVVLHPEMRRLQVGQRLGQPAADRILHVAARGVENDRVTPGEQRGDLIGGNALGEPGFHGQPVFLGDFRNRTELAGGNRRGGDDEDVLRRRAMPR